MTVKIRLKENKKLNIEYTKYLLLNDKIKISSIPCHIRMANQSIYIMSFRSANNKRNCEKFIDTLAILSNDIRTCNDDIKKKSLENIFNNYLGVFMKSVLPLIDIGDKKAVLFYKTTAFIFSDYISYLVGTGYFSLYEIADRHEFGHEFDVCFLCRELEEKELSVFDGVSYTLVTQAYNLAPMEHRVVIIRTVNNHSEAQAILNSYISALNKLDY